MVSDLELRVAVHDTMGTLVKLQNDLQVYGRSAAWATTPSSGAART